MINLLANSYQWNESKANGMILVGGEQDDYQKKKYSTSGGSDCNRDDEYWLNKF